MNPNASISWNTSSWLGAASRPQQQTSLKKTIQAYKAISHRLKGKLEQLLQKKEELSSRAFAVVSEVVVEREQQEGQKGSREATPTPRPLSPPPPQQIKIEASDYHSDDLSSLASAVTNILTESIEIRLAFVMEAIQYLSTLYQDNPKQRTPTELMLSRYEEWVETNQRLFELNSRLYDLEKVKFDLQQRDTVDQGSTKQEVSHTGNQLVQSNALKIQSFLSRYQFPRHTPSTTQAYLQEVLIKRGDRVTLEAQKVQEYVNECIQNSQVDLQIITGAHPQNYQQFMAVLCNFIVDRQREVQGVHLPLNLVYSTVEHVVVPQIQSAILRHAQRRDSDAKIREQCEAFSDITMHQLSIKPAYWSPQREPFIESIAQLRATYFSPTPTDKMSSVVAAAKALYDQLSSMGENSIDGDSFLDLWIYVIIKANIPDLATNIEFMSLYGNPSLGMDEAGYYLTTLSIAANFIEHKLKEEELKKHDSGHFVVCEREKFLALSQASRFCFKTESEREELRGYKVAVIKEWVLNNAR